MLLKVYDKGINSSDFREICNYLNKGYAVDFVCGLKTWGGDEKSPVFTAHVDGWVGRIKDEYKRRYGDMPVESMYCSPEDKYKARVFINQPIYKNSDAKRLLESSY